MAKSGFASGARIHGLRAAAFAPSPLQAGTPGDDTLTGGEAGNWIAGYAGNDVLLGFAGADTLSGGSGADTLNGGSGADLLRGGYGNDRYVVTPGDYVKELAGHGSDTILSASACTLGSFLENLVLTGISDVAGGGNSLANVLTGNGGNNYLAGAGGNDTLRGGGGADVLNGGPGNDVLAGGSATDAFWFATPLSADTNVDTVLGFHSESDQLRLEARFFAVLGPNGLSAEEFVSGAGVAAGQDADDRIVYDSDTGRLYYDADGAGGTATVLFAILQGAPALLSSDFHMSYRLGQP